MADLLAKARESKQRTKDFTAQQATIPPNRAAEIPPPDKNIVTKPLATTDRIAALKAMLAAKKEPPAMVPLRDSVKEEIKQATFDSVGVQDPPEKTATTATGMHGEAITYNHKQQEFIDLVASGQSCVLLGAAGTGKTTCSKGANAALIASGCLPVLQTDGHKHLRAGSPGVIIISYTRRAVNNIRKVQSEDLKNNCITAHKLLEYQPVYYEITDPATGLAKNTMAFEPSRCATNPLPSSIYTIEVEEGSMLSRTL